MSCDYIDDGYQEPGYIAAEEGLHGPLEFEFRPILAAQRDRANSLIQREQPQFDRFHEEAGKALAGAVKRWSITDRSGNPVPITADTLKRIKPRLLDKLWVVCTGAMTSDARPGQAEHKIDLEADAKN